MPRQSLSNRTPDERISFSLQNDPEESNTATLAKGSIEIVADEAQLTQPKKTEEAYHIVSKQGKEGNLQINKSKHNESNLSKAHMSWFANSSNTTKKVYQVPKNQIESTANPLFQSSFEKSNESKPFSPFQSSESTLKRQQWSKNFADLKNNSKKMPILNLNNIERSNFHEEFMNTATNWI